MELLFYKGEFMNKKLFLPLAMTLLLSSFSFAKGSQWSVCDFNNKNKFTLTVNMFAGKLTFFSSQFPKEPVEMSNIKSNSLPATGGYFTYSGITESTLASVVSYTGLFKNKTTNFYLFTYQNNDLGVGVDDSNNGTFFGKASWCNK